MKAKQNFTEGPILSTLTKFAMPVLLAILLQDMYGAVDLQMVGRFGTAADISAAATGSQIMFMVSAVIIGLAMGITVRIGQQIGDGRPEDAGKTVGSGICLFVVAALVLTAGMLLGAPSIARGVHAPPDAFDGTVRYLRICGVGSLFIIGYNLVGSIFRGLGDSKMPLITVAIACAVNIAGDLLLVGGLGMGVTGAAVATVAAQAVSVALSLLIIRRRQLPFSLSKEDIHFNREINRSILKIGTPAALQDLLHNISFLVLVTIANSMGTIMSASVGVGGKVSVFLVVVPSAYMQAMSAFVAQNIGAGRETRARRALLCGILSSLAVGLIVAWMTFFHGDVLAGIFSKEAAVIAGAADYLKAYGVDCLLQCLVFCCVGYFNGCGHTFFVMVQGLIGAFGVRLLMAMLLSRIAGGSLLILGLAIPGATAVQVFICAGFLIWRTRKVKSGFVFQKIS